jgi:hypothetical protein
MTKKVAILQSNYIPWKGYFDLISEVDEFILYDEMQFTKNDWRNRNKIKTSQGIQWITIPCLNRTLTQKINETKVLNNGWAKKHINTLTTNYSKAKCFKEYIDVFSELYNRASHLQDLSEINFLFLSEICKILGINTKISWSSKYTLIEGKTERLVALCQQTEASEYISGPSAKNYIEADLFETAKIKLTWKDYSGYSEYNQLFPPFEHGVSIIDLLFNEGGNAINLIKSQ